MKRKLTKKAFEALSEHLQALYKLQDDGSYVLEVEDDDDEQTLERLKLKQHIEAEHRRKAEKERDELRKKLKEIEDEQQGIKDEANRKKGDVAALEASWKTKLETREAELQASIDKGTAALKGLLVDAAAKDIAVRISTAPDLLAPIIAARLKVEYQDDKPITRVLDALGQPSAASLEDLEKEIAGDKRYAPVIIAGKGSGGGGHGTPNQAGGQKKLSDMSEQERIDWFKRDPDGFRKASTEQFNA